MATIQTVYADWPVRPMPMSRGRIHFRMHYVESIGRYVVERYCSFRGWIAIHFDDFASTAFFELKAIAERSFGYVVCAKCKKELADPQLSSRGVVCADCESSTSPIRGLIIGMFITAEGFAAFYAAMCFAHMGGIR